MPAVGTPSAPELLLLPLDQIRPDPDQPRRTIDVALVRELAASIRQVGLIHPIAVRPGPDGGYVIVSGERRWRAYGHLAEADPAFATIPAMVRARESAEARLAALVENIQREDLNPIERADALHALRKVLRTTWAGVAKQTGLRERRVYQLAGLTTVRREVRQAAANGDLGEGQVRAVHMLGKGEDALQLLDYLRENPGINREEALDLARVMKRNPGLPPFAAAELRKAGHPATELPPLPPPLDQTTAGRGLAAAKLFLRFLDELDDQPYPGEAGDELLHLVDLIAARGGVLKVAWRDRGPEE